MPIWAQWVSLVAEPLILVAIVVEIILSVLDRATQRRRDEVMERVASSLEDSSAELAEIADAEVKE